jgi:toxin-antitoxin system PIN domain toxin
LSTHSDPADLPDLNVWLALTASQHPHHAQALTYWEQQASSRVLFCTVTALGLVRLLSQPKLMGAAVLGSAEASALLQEFRREPGVAMAAPEHDGWDLFHAMLTTLELPARHHTDAYLAALAISNGWRLVSFDRAFERFQGLNWLPIS